MVSVDDVIQGAEVHVLKWKYRSINTESLSAGLCTVCTTGLLKILLCELSVCVQRDSVTLSSGSGDFSPFFSIELLVITVLETFIVGYLDKMSLKCCYLCIIRNSHMPHSGHEEVRGQLCKVSLLLLPGFWDLNS